MTHSSRNLEFDLAFKLSLMLASSDISIKLIAARKTPIIEASATMGIKGDSLFRNINRTPVASDTAKKMNVIKSFGYA